MLKFVLLSMLLSLAFARPARAYTYEPFPALPVASVKKNDFVQKLRDSCKKLKDSAPATPYATKLKPVCEKLYVRTAGVLTGTDLDVLREAVAQPGLLPAAATEGAAASNEDVAGPMTLGGLSDQLVRGMAEFLQKRAQQEALRELRLRLKKELCEGTGEAGELRKAGFSNLCAAIDSAEGDVSLEAMGSYIRAAAERDLKKLPDLLLDYLEKDKAYAGSAFAGRLGLATFGAARGGRQVLEIVYSLGELERRPCEIAGSCRSVGNAVRLASALTYAVQQGGDESTNFFKTLKPEDAPVAAVGLLLLVEARLKDLAAGFAPADPRNRGELGFSLDARVFARILEKPLASVSEIVALRRVWTNLELSLKNVSAEDARQTAISMAVVDSAAVVERLLQYATSLAPPSVQPPAVQLTHLEDFVRTAELLRRREYGEAIVTSIAQVKAMAPGNPVVAKLSAHVAFVVEIASASSSNEVAAAFDAYAAPVGSYELKYKKPTLAINGFLGAHAGWERMSSNGVQGVSPTVGGFAPVGVHASMPLAKDHVHLGLLLSVLDLGAVTSVRTDDTAQGDLPNATDPETSAPKAKSAPQIGVAQVFSPGAYLVIGIAGSPLVAGFGAALSPELREVTQDGAATTDVSVLRYGGFLAADIPILPFN